MLPEDSLSSELAARYLLYPDSLPFSNSRDYEMGGIAISDPSQGLLVQPWTAYVDEEGYIYVAPIGTEDPAPLMQVEDATWLGITFDRNMNVVLCWWIEAENTSYLYWFDSTVSAYVTTSYPDTRCPRVCHDDKRPEANDWSDVVFAYIDTEENALYMRYQRDRYGTAYWLADVSAPQYRYFTKMGMSTNNRILFEFSTWRGN